MATTTRNLIATKAALKTLKPRCGDCEGFECTRLIEKQKGFCNANGKTRYSSTCPNYQANLEPMRDFIGSDPFDALTQLIQSLPDNQLRMFGSLLYSENNNRRNGFQFGQKIYVRYRGLAGSNYLSNFMSAHVMSCQGDYIKVMSRDGRCSASFLLSNKNQLFTVERFEKLRDRLIRQGKLVDPDTLTMLNRRMRAEEEYELGMTKDSKNGVITTIDTVFKENKIRRGKSGVTADLVTIVAGIQQGHDMTRETKTYKVKERVAKGDSVIDVTGA